MLLNISNKINPAANNTWFYGSSSTWTFSVNQKQKVDVLTRQEDENHDEGPHGADRFCSVLFSCVWCAGVEPERRLTSLTAGAAIYTLVTRKQWHIFTIIICGCDTRLASLHQNIYLFPRYSNYYDDDDDHDDDMLLLGILKKKNPIIS